MNHNANLAYPRNVNSVLARDELDKKRRHRLRKKWRSQPELIFDRSNQLRNLKTQTNIRPLLNLSLAETVSALTEIINFESDLLENNDRLYLSASELDDKLKVLVIEDRDDSRDCICSMLKTENFQVIEAQDSETAIQLAQTETPDLIICELMMPSMNGCGITDLFSHSAITNSILLLFITAHSKKTNIASEILLASDGEERESLTKQKLLRAINRHINMAIVFS